MKHKVIATGLSGLVGTRVKELLQDKVDFTDLSYTSGVDITNLNQLNEHFQTSQAKVVLHLAAKTDVDNCEDDKILGEEGQAWLINVVGTENVAYLASKTGKRVIYISTDFIFAGTKDYYTENDQPNPLNWYGYTKYKGEGKVMELNPDNTILRLAYPYRAFFSQKKDFLAKILEKCQHQQVIFALTDHIFTPTFIDDIAYAFLYFIEHSQPGIYHLTGSQSLTVYQAVSLISRTFGVKVKVKKVTRKGYFQDRAYRPFKLALRNDKITKLGIKMRSFAQGLIEVKKQLEILKKVEV